ncbi:bifunctional proline dehydrogenase/L-glutamate gamma-semialdehyde dehydrogenase PutA [Hyphococcus luteus]|uniref:Bifunctional protein PutA n=1 Tax=Hyphococcus luteus TaxID=2058213 RepID=A0A2S7K329_9PROT|nr:bifunctional proline dehydrogenase/L-glutamate gamma-semialdehyde dehydrogenase PutA [Marinicaulis flavus]PQA86897.1 bifunctional proline dehydrogenase/L-glutamate gamma-semialdehyde dehydrogenase [Marinicaulis flavus]
MSQNAPLAPLRARIRDHYLAPEDMLFPALAAAAGLDDATRDEAQARAADFVRAARANAERSGLIDKFLQEYGLSTAEGVTLMRLAEALLRTPDATTADSLIEDKIEAGDWGAHKGKSPFPLVNFSTRALMLTASWLDEIEAKDPLGRMAKATKDALDRLGEPVIRASVAQAMRIMGEHFVLGETIESALKRARRFEDKGYVFSYDMLGEAAHTDADALKYFDDYKTAIAAIAKHSKHDYAPANPGISVKLSALHPRYEYGKKTRVLSELGGRVCDLAIEAKAANMGFNIDAEEADRLDLSLDIIEQLMRDPALDGWDGFGVVVQAYQRRAPYVLDWLAALTRETGRRITVRLVKGAYWDSEIKRAQMMGLESYPVFTRKALTDVSYLACARKLFDNIDVFFPQFATHNALSAAMVQKMAGAHKDYELQRLYGMGEALHDSLIETGARSRIYAPVGGHRELLPYLVRRLLENGANSSFVNQLIDPDLSVDDVVADPLEEIAGLSAYANPHIPAPRDTLGGERLAAKGWDETHPPTAEQMSPAARSMLAPVEAQPIVNGETLSGARVSVTNPAFENDPVGAVHNAGEADVDAACDAAAGYAKDWAATPAAERAAPLRRAADMLEDRGEHFMALAIYEAGKTWPDAIAEVREAVDFLRYYADRSEELPGAPLGVVACISPWNFPLAIFLGQVSASLAAGNCVIAKPAEQTPLIAFEAVKLLHEAGVPAGALHYLPGDGPSVGAPLATHPHVAGVVFTGSIEVAHIIKKSLVAAGKPDAALIAETGGINAMIVDSTALLEQAVMDVVSSAFQSAGQRCSACRVVCVQEDVAERFNEMLAGAMAELAVGDPAELYTDVGPVIDEEARETIQHYADHMKFEATPVAFAPEPDHGVSGTFVRPAAFEIRKLSDLKREIFGPVLHVLRFNGDKLDGLVDDINALGYGLTMGVHTRIDETMERVARRARIGNVYVNRNQIGAVVGVQPFGGEGLSGTGPKAGGPHYLSALQERPRPDGEAPAPVMESEESSLEKAARENALHALRAWNAVERGPVLDKTMQRLDGVDESLAREIADAHAVFAANTELPGPTGESNTLKLRARGLALCLGGGGPDGADLKQMLLCLAAGNTVIAVEGDAAKNLAAALAAAGAPKGALAIAGPHLSHALLKDPHIRLAAFDGAAAGRAEIERVLAQRKGPIIPLVSSLDAPWRFAAERALTINTTAAGGDVRLLSLGE